MNKAAPYSPRLDRLHPRKRARPIASRELNPSIALGFASVLAVVGIAWSGLLSPHFAMCALAYLLMMLAYSVSLKDVFLIDSLLIAMGFIVRAVAGVIVLRTPTSPPVPLTAWFVVCVMFLSLLLAFCKRRSEKYRLDGEAPGFRAVLGLYSPMLLDQAIAFSATGAILAYALYAVEAQNPWAMLSTIPFVIFGILRYLHLVYGNEDGEAPELVLLRDVPLLGCILLWVVSMLVVYSFLT